MTSSTRRSPRRTGGRRAISHGGGEIVHRLLELNREIAAGTRTYGPFGAQAWAAQELLFRRVARQGGGVRARDGRRPAACWPTWQKLNLDERAIWFPGAPGGYPGGRPGRGAVRGGAAEGLGAARGVVLSAPVGPPSARNSVVSTWEHPLRAYLLLHSVD